MHKTKATLRGSINTQLMVLTHDSGDWRIRTISWSSNQP